MGRERLCMNYERKDKIRIGQVMLKQVQGIGVLGIRRDFTSDGVKE